MQCVAHFLKRQIKLVTEARTRFHPGRLKSYTVYSASSNGSTINHYYFEITTCRNLSTIVDKNAYNVDTLSENSVTDPSQSNYHSEDLFDSGGVSSAKSSALRHINNQQVNEYPHSAFEDDFLAGDVDEEYLEYLVGSVSINEQLHNFYIMKSMEKIAVPFDNKAIEDIEDEHEDVGDESLSVYDVVESKMDSSNSSLLSISDQTQLERHSAETDNGSEMLENSLPINSRLSTVSVDLNTLESLRPLPPPVSHSLAAYVNYSPTLQRLIQIGVNLHHCAKEPQLATALLNMDIEQHLMPRLLFLKDSGFDDTEAVKLINSHPPLLVEPLADIHARIDYLVSKRFDKATITGCIRACPMLLTTPVKLIDRHLGFVFNEFKLTATELRHVISKNPHVFNQLPRNMLFINRTLRRIFEFDDKERRDALMNCPRILTTAHERLLANYHYLYCDMELDKAAILTAPAALCVRPQLLRGRHQLLRDLGRLQLDPTKPNYVSLNAIATHTGDEFRTKVAKIDKEKWKQYKATL